MTQKEMLDLIPEMKQRQDALLDQLMDLHAVAIKLGMYDAADWMKNRLYNNK